MTMPPYQPPADSVLVNPIEPFGSPELGALLTTISAHLNRPSYRITHGGPVELEGHVWAPEGADFSPAVRRALYDAVEEAIASVEKLGWTHAKEPAIHITVTERDVFESVSPPRVGAHVFLTLLQPAEPEDDGTASAPTKTIRLSVDARTVPFRTVSDIIDTAIPVEEWEAMTPEQRLEHGDKAHREWMFEQLEYGWKVAQYDTPLQGQAAQDALKAAAKKAVSRGYPMSTDPVVAFYAARLDEDEQAAVNWQAHKRILADQRRNDPRKNHVRPFRSPVTEAQVAEYAYTTRFNPGRALAEVEAKRRTLARHTPEPMNGYDSDVNDPSTWVPGCPTCQVGVVQAGDWPCEEIRDALSVHNTHPDYLDEWRP